MYAAKPTQYNWGSGLATLIERKNTARLVSENTLELAAFSVQRSTGHQDRYVDFQR